MISIWLTDLRFTSDYFERARVLLVSLLSRGFPVNPRARRVFQSLGAARLDSETSEFRTFRVRSEINKTFYTLCVYAVL